MTAGLLAVASEPGRVPEDEFHSWYDAEHVPLRLALPGVHTGRRLQATDGRTPTWLALYDLDLEVLDRPDYRRLRNDRSARERSVIERLTVLDRRIYALETAYGPEPPDPHTVVWTALDVPRREESELAAWYDQEHVPLLHAIPGWDRTRRYRLVEGGGPRWLAVHELSDPRALEADAYRAATSTERRSRLMEQVTARERRTWRTYRIF